MPSMFANNKIFQMILNKIISSIVSTFLKKHHLSLIYIYKKDFVRERKIRNRKKERATETLNLKLNTKPLKFKCGLAMGEGGRAGLVYPCKAWVPPPSII